eukprot:CAMPEP_0176345998 /NCGR_PEP_ID=MMETSP0126-20121128/5893_1 /TAXON_ID=141414 ORGANISM="Strombidinopsis acuminatum, Strain SPMC142" /NCGR_SAMPLE_ID=MMETSP0126 /ASSEMBLY_ACC=CAM_ASM_000229 /LENGTH=99 /DNA_ID=CAMNT_0017693285 /DNA_START=784 /DNA_END=1083 /DNA_ORIENTATION=+
MSYLPNNNSLCIAGGRNDEMCKKGQSHFLNDIHLFMLDQKVWLKVKYTPQSERIDYISNHCMSVISTGEDYESLIVFGGLCTKIVEKTDGETSVSAKDG